ncbi:MAG: helix-turn-helix transcriptional regulator [candidate division Zixibacteria bacterium]|jgi:transcriptional regulator with XRE-family HTH domain|nr:helix-turn-helix transcriptional regulator [candidate division Zixibacteria bacterium]
MDFGGMIRNARTEKGWTVKEFIERMTADGSTRISPAYVTRVEQYREIPSPEMVARMAEVLEIELEPLVAAAKQNKMESFKERLDAKYGEAAIFYRKVNKRGR